MTTYAVDKVFDLFFGAVALTPPPTWYAGLSTTRSVVAGTVTEPSGNGYARTSFTNNAAAWGVKAYQPTPTWNASALTFATPTGAWGTVTTVFLADASSAGNVWATADLPNAVAPTSNVVPMIKPGGLYVQIG